MTNCPNCGAPITGHKCEYCGAVIFDFACIEMDKPFWMSIKNPDGSIYFAKVMLDNMSHDCYGDNYGLYADNQLWSVVYSCPTRYIHMSFVEVPSSNGISHVVSTRSSVGPDVLEV